MITQNLLKRWLELDMRQRYADTMMEREVFAGEERCCLNCAPSDCRYRCTECFGGLRMSASCIVVEHAKHPLHVIEVHPLLPLGDVMLTLLNFRSVGSNIGEY
jgi:hypothetical protein